MSTTTKIICPECSSEDCNRTFKEIDKLIISTVQTVTIFCNHCGYTKASLLANRREVVTEERLSGGEDTEIEFA